MLIQTITIIRQHRVVKNHRVVDYKIYLPFMYVFKRFWKCIEWTKSFLNLLCIIGSGKKVAHMDTYGCFPVRNLIIMQYKITLLLSPFPLTVPEKQSRIYTKPSIFADFCGHWFPNFTASPSQKKFREKTGSGKYLDLKFPNFFEYHILLYEHTKKLISTLRRAKIFNN